MNRLAVILHNQYKKAVGEKAQNIKYMLTDDITSWYILLTNINDHNVELLFKMKIPSDYPLQPPDFYILTQNNIITINDKICIQLSLGLPPNISSFANLLIAKLIEDHIDYDLQQHTRYNDINNIDIIKKMRLL
jgi:ubiquitin-protein ligase